MCILDNLRRWLRNILCMSDEQLPKTVNFGYLSGAILNAGHPWAGQDKVTRKDLKDIKTSLNGIKSEALKGLAVRRVWTAITCLPCVCYAYLLVSWSCFALFIMCFALICLLCALYYRCLGVSRRIIPNSTACWLQLPRCCSKLLVIT